MGIIVKLPGNIMVKFPACGVVNMVKFPIRVGSIVMFPAARVVVIMGIMVKFTGTTVKLLIGFIMVTFPAGA